MLVVAPLCNLIPQHGLMFPANYHNMCELSLLLSQENRGTLPVRSHRGDRFASSSLVSFIKCRMGCCIPCSVGMCFCVSEAWQSNKHTIPGEAHLWVKSWLTACKMLGVDGDTCSCVVPVWGGSYNRCLRVGCAVWVNLPVLSLSLLVAGAEWLIAYEDGREGSWGGETAAAVRGGTLGGPLLCKEVVEGDCTQSFLLGGRGGNEEDGGAKLERDE